MKFNKLTTRLLSIMAMLTTSFVSHAEVTNSCGTYPEEATSPYILPYPVGSSYRVSQGNCSDNTHTVDRPFNTYAYDFQLAIGDPVLAARSGVVGFVKESARNTNRDRSDFNFIRVDHDDGLSSFYLHLAQDGALVEVGDTVTQGQQIALAGDTGLPNLPHLHFDVRDANNITIPITFNNISPSAPGGLERGIFYTALPFTTEDNDSGSSNMVPGDHTGDAKSDILIRNLSTGVWQLNPLDGRSVLRDTDFGRAFLTTSLSLTTQAVRDFTGDGKSDVLLRNSSTGEWTLNPMSGKTVLNDANNGTVDLPVEMAWELVAAADFTQDGMADVLLRNNSNGIWRLYPMNGRTIINDSNLGRVSITSDLTWNLVAAADFNNDSFADILLRNNISGQWLMIPLQGRNVLRNSDFGGLPVTQDLSWEVAGASDVTGDGSADLMLRNNVTGRWLLLPVEGRTINRGNNFGGVRFLAIEQEWQTVRFEDFTGDGLADMLIRNNQTGAWRMHPMEGRTVVRDTNFGGVAITLDTTWQPQ